MLKGVLTKRVLLGLAAAGAVVGGGLVGIELPALADTAVTFADAQTFVVSANMSRISGAAVACSGVCRTATAGGTYRLRCPLSIEPSPASFAACLVALNTACTTTACADATP